MAKRTDYYKRLGEQVAKLRKQAKISQERMAKFVGIDRALISRFESQGEKIPTERIDAMLDVLGYELSIVEKKNFTDRRSLKFRLQQLLRAAEEVVDEMNNHTEFDASWSGTPASDHQKRDYSEEPGEA